MRMPLIVPLLLLVAVTGAMAEEEYPQSARLKDGSIVFIDNDGAMKMVDKRGNPMRMKDGVPMELEDGSVIMMKNHAIWKRVPRGTLNPKFNP